MSTDNAPRPMTPIEALQILDAATTPANVGKLNRADFINIQTALEVLARVVQPVGQLNGKPPDLTNMAQGAAPEPLRRNRA